MLTNFFLLGYAIGAVLGGFLYRYVGGRGALQIFSAIGVISSIAHYVLHMTVLRNCKPPDASKENGYKSPAEAALTAEHHDQ